MGRLVPPPFNAPQEQWDRYLGHGRMCRRVLQVGLLLCALLAVLLFFASCSRLTVAPIPVHANAVAMGETNKPDADVVDCDKDGCIVRKGWVDSYFALETKFKENVPADRLIVGNTDNTYRVPYPVVSHDAEMRRKQRLAEAGP